MELEIAELPLDDENAAADIGMLQRHVGQRLDVEAGRHFDDLRRTMKRDRMAAVITSAQRKRARFYGPLLGQLGRWLVAWGMRLQMRYSPLADTTISTKTHGNISRN